jgi:hypothetical protein
MNETQVRSIFKQLKARLEAKAWFTKGHWIAALHPFPKDAPEGVTFHVFKKHWHNEDRLGIHFESYLAFDERKRKKSYVTIHVLHHDKIPGTNRKRVEISKPFIDAVLSEVKGWGDFQIRAGKYGMQPFSKTLDGNDLVFADTIEKEFSRLCTRLGPAMDRAIARTQELEASL